jgi:selenocysteine lyase/cysteine desulfurase
MAQQKINVSVSTAESTRLDMDQRGLRDVVRASVHYYNSESEIERFSEALNEIL